MASDFSGEERLTLFLRSLDQHSWGNKSTTDQVPAKEVPNTEEEDIVTTDTQDNFWKYEEPESEEDEPEDQHLKSLKLEKEFLEEKGYK